MSPQFMILNIGMCQETWEDLGMSRRMYLALKISDNLRDLVVSIVGAFWLWAKIDPANCERLTSQTIRVSVTRGSGYVCPGKLNRLSLSPGDRRRLRNIRRRWNVGRTEFRMWDIRVECRRRKIPDVRYPGGMSAEKNSGCDIPGWNEWCHVS